MLTALSLIDTAPAKYVRCRSRAKWGPKSRPSGLAGRMMVSSCRPIEVNAATTKWARLANEDASVSSFHIVEVTGSRLVRTSPRPEPTSRTSPPASEMASWAPAGTRPARMRTTAIMHYTEYADRLSPSPLGTRQIRTRARLRAELGLDFLQLSNYSVSFGAVLMDQSDQPEAQESGQ